MKARFRSWAWALLGCSLLRGAAPGAPVGQVRFPELRLEPLAHLDPGGPVALSPDGRSIAYVDQGLRILDTATGRTRQVAGPVPTCLAWSPDGRCLAAGFAGVASSRLQRLDPQGALKAEAEVAGCLTSLHWSGDGALLALALQVQRFRFGTQLAEVLQSWKGTAPPTPRTLCEATLMPREAERLAPLLPRRLTFSISPFGDEILYARLYSPPALPSRVRWMLFPLGAGREREVAEAALEGGVARFAPDGLSALCGDGRSTCRRLDLWGDRVLARFPEPGREVAESASGRWQFMDGVLWCDGRSVHTFPPGSRAWFARRGGLAWVAEGDRLFRLSGAGEPPPALPDAAEAARIRRFRRWLAQGLIASEDYRKQAEGGRP